jgi:hypothetical protein
LWGEAFENQKDYLKFTPKPDKMSVKDWRNRIKNINSYLPLMEHEARSFSELGTHHQSHLQKYSLSLESPTQTVKVTFESKDQ